MAYAAVTSLFHTIHLLLASSRTSLTSSTRKILKSARRGAKRLQRTLERYDNIQNNSEGVMGVEAGIRDEACRLEDLIESQASAQFHSQSQSHGRFFLNLHHLRHDVECFVERAKKMRTKYVEELYKPSPPQEDAASSTCTDQSTGSNCDMVGLCDLFLQIRADIVADSYLNEVFFITGMAGIGKTTLVKKLYHDPLIRKDFECCAFVRVGHKYEFEDVLRSIIAQINDDSCNTTREMDEDIDDYLERCLTGRKYFIVLDDLWDENFVLCFERFQQVNGYVLVTSRIQGQIGYNEYEMRFMNEDESWELLRRKVFGEGERDNCPPQLIKPGKKIAENCEGLPLLILTVAQHLRDLPKTLEYWNEVALMRNSVLEDACDEIHEILVTSYHFMEQNAKGCFLYMCVFPKDYVVRSSRIVDLWCAEKFANERDRYTLDYIISRNLAVVKENCFTSDFKTKAFNLHVAHRHMSRRESNDNEFVYILSRYDADCPIQRIEEKRRLAIYHNTLLAIKEVHSYIDSVTSLRSVLCTGPYHQYQVPLCLELKLQVRVLDALSIRFYEFPVEVVKLIRLRYLSFTTNANLPPLINKLWFLEYLIVDQHWRIHRSVDKKSYVPVEIWELKELKHLQIVGRNLPHPPHGGSLPNLINLLDVGAQSCAKAILDNIPKLEKLRIQIESAPDHHHHEAPTMISFFDHTCSLNDLDSLGIVAINPKLMSKTRFSPGRRLLLFPMNNLRKLSLSGFGYPWEDMSKIGELPYLQHLKLKCYAFQGEIWEAKAMTFPNVRCLLIDDTDLVEWKATDETLPRLQSLCLRNCYKLHELPLIQTLVKIELVDCNPLVETHAKRQSNAPQLLVSYSWKL